jgi:hypothetical protein
MAHILLEEAKNILPSGKCPDCLRQVRIIEIDGDFYKNKNYKIFHNGTRVLRCLNIKCKALLIE